MPPVLLGKGNVGPQACQDASVHPEGHAPVVQLFPAVQLLLGDIPGLNQRFRLPEGIRRRQVLPKEPRQVEPVRIGIVGLFHLDTGKRPVRIIVKGHRGQVYRSVASLPVGIQGNPAALFQLLFPRQLRRGRVPEEQVFPVCKAGVRVPRLHPAAVIPGVVLSVPLHPPVGVLLAVVGVQHPEGVSAQSGNSPGPPDAAPAVGAIKLIAEALLAQRRVNVPAIML